MKTITKMLLVSILALAIFCVAGCQPQEEPAHTHTLIHNAAKAPTCVNNGILEHWYCPACNARFADEAATQEVTFADLEIEETGHTGGTATCTEQAICDTCGKAYGEVLGHTGGTATCTEQAVCERCNTAYGALLAHTPNEDDGDCTTAITCSVCGATTTAAATEHTGGTATCTEQAVCEVCGKAYGETLTHTGGTATCTTQATCEHCGQPYGELAAHIDTNLDITCDFEGCTKRILPAADSKVSLFTANHMIIVSFSNNYYVEGTITEITDAKNGIFIIEDEAGYSLLVRLPKNAEGTSYSSWTDCKVMVGDKVQLYGKPVKNSSTPTTEKAKIEGGVLTILEHNHNFSEATCTNASVCACLAVNAPALGHIDENSDDLCDRCPWNMKLAISSIVVRTDAEGNGVLAEDKSSWTWGNDDFDVVIAKGTSTYTLYTTAKTYMQLKKQNTLTVVNKGDKLIDSITIGVTNTSYLTYIESMLSSYEYTKDETALTITIKCSSADDIVLTNNTTSTIYVNSVAITYEK